MHETADNADKRGFRRGIIFAHETLPPMAIQRVCGTFAGAVRFDHLFLD
jgi:hypothetical protein